MKFVSFQLPNGQTGWGVLDQNQIVGINHPSYPTLLHFIEAGENINLLHEWIKQQESPLYSLEEAELLVPIAPRKNIFCIGKNYKEHALEMSNQDINAIPKHPVIFTKPYTTLLPHLKEIDPHSEITDQVDYEGELAIIIGKRGSNISIEEAYDYIFGYSIMNDVTARDLQKKHQQFFKGKSLDTFAPFGPSITHHTAIADPQNLSIKTYVNDELRQNGNTQDMIFSIPEIIAIISAGMTLEPGDIIATGTPSGVGSGYNPPRYIKPGDEVTIEIEGLGLLRNTVKK